MTLRKLLIGNFLTFVKEGALVDSVTVSSTAKPDHVPTSNWDKFGDIEDANLDPKLTEEPVFSPLAAGGYGRSDIFTKTSELTIALTVQDMNEVIFQMLLLSTALSSGAGVPLAATGQLKGWWNVVQRDQNGTIVNTFEVWARGKVNAVKFGNTPAKATLVLDVLSNALNVMTVTV